MARVDRAEWVVVGPKDWIMAWGHLLEREVSAASAAVVAAAVMALSAAPIPVRATAVAAALAVAVGVAGLVCVRA